MKSIFIFILWLLPFAAHSFTLSDHPTNRLKGFSGPIIQFHVNPQNCSSDIKGLVRAAVNFLNELPNRSYHLRLGRDVRWPIKHLRQFPFTEQVIVACSINFNKDSLGFNANRVAGIGTNNFPSSPISKGFIILNFDPFVKGRSNASFNNPAYSPLKKVIVVAHEIGHVLGLGHSQSPQALMNGNVWEKKYLSLHPDDVAGLNFLYGSKTKVSPPPILARSTDESTVQSNKAVKEKLALAKIPMPLIAFFIVIPFLVRIYFWLR